MTKYLKTIAFASSIILIVFFLLAAIYIQDKNNSLSLTYDARKEDLLANQQQIELILSDLNKTLETALAREENLTKELAALENSSSTVQPTPSTTTTPTPKPAPTPVTRAS